MQISVFVWLTHVIPTLEVIKQDAILLPGSELGAQRSTGRITVAAMPQVKWILLCN